MSSLAQSPGADPLPPRVGVVVYERLAERAARRLAVTERRERWLPRVVQAGVVVSAAVLGLSALDVYGPGDPRVLPMLGVVGGAVALSASVTWSVMRRRGADPVTAARVQYEAYRRLLARSRMARSQTSSADQAEEAGQSYRGGDRRGAS